ncbi:hypothetical protein L1987_31622 [Smallanthus sonchifolius]|uniref:Uncharacterized protein n=1 Tax=Smallanthus sonchifolius TaxID=185202 RepID=A0ACB9I7I8_9ASTR|nr:hypothetical protein L1987_31622 [Smallanthus sonchifolius]
MAEIRRKVDASTNVMLGKDVFLLTLKPGFDGAFAMGLVLVLDQINGDDGAIDLDPTIDYVILTTLTSHKAERCFPFDVIKRKELLECERHL